MYLIGTPLVLARIWLSNQTHTQRRIATQAQHSLGRISSPPQYTLLQANTILQGPRVLHELGIRFLASARFAKLNFYVCLTWSTQILRSLKVKNLIAVNKLARSEARMESDGTSVLRRI